jgi:ABC-type multidrug transport system fused ATPase/permease subunit
MYQTDSRVTLIVVLPMVIIIVVTRALSDRIKATHSAARAAAANVSEQLGGLFGGVLSLKVADRELSRAHGGRDEEQHDAGTELDARRGDRVEQVGEESGADFEGPPHGVVLSQAGDGGLLGAGDLERQHSAEEPAELFGHVGRR